MKIITKLNAIAAGIKNFIEQYEGLTKFEVSVQQLRKLNPDTCSEEDVSAIIGNNSWTALKCDECRQPVDTVAEVGWWDNDAVACVCLDCLKQAVEAMERVQ